MARILFITGGPGSGKSSVARRVAEQFDRSFHLQVDELREGMVRGFAFPSLPFPDEVATQFRVARRTASFMAREYADSGITFVIDDAPLPSDFADWYAELFADEQVVRIMLVTDGSTMVERMRRRNGPFDEGLIAIGAEALSEYIATLPRDGWTVIDNTNSTLDDTVSEVLVRFRS